MLPTLIVLLTSSSASLLCKMPPWSNSPLPPQRLLCIVVLRVFLGQEVIAQQEVTEYLGHDATLPCPCPLGKDNNVTQLQWLFRHAEGQNQTSIIISNPPNSLHIAETFLKERVKISQQSLIIREVENGDAGIYTCKIASFPSGSFEGTIKLVVQEQIIRSPAEVSAIVIAVLLLLVVMAAIVYLLYIRRTKSSVRHSVNVDTNGPMMDATEAVMVGKEDVVYSDVKLSLPAGAGPSSKNKHAKAAHADDITYSEVIVLCPQPR